MKITETKLRDIIKQELLSLNESKGVSSELEKLNDLFLEYNRRIGILEYEVNNAGGKGDFQKHLKSIEKHHEMILREAGKYE